MISYMLTLYLISNIAPDVRVRRYHFKTNRQCEMMVEYYKYHPFIIDEDKKIAIKVSKAICTEMRDT